MKKGWSRDLISTMNSMQFTPHHSLVVHKPTATTLIERPTGVEPEEMLSPVLRDGASMLTSLPYIDRELDTPGMQAHVSSIIEAEMAGMDSERDYLAHRPAPELKILSGDPSKSGALAAVEMARLAAGKEDMEPLDFSRYNVDPPEPALQRDAQAWVAAVRNCRAQLEHQNNRLLNLELCSNFGPKIWLQHNQDLTKTAEALEAQLTSARAASEALNLKRKLAQEKAGPEFARHEANYRAAVAKNAEIETANAHLRLDIKRLRAAAAERGIAVPDPEPEPVAAKSAEAGDGDASGEAEEASMDIECSGGDWSVAPQGDYK